MSKHSFARIERSAILMTLFMVSGGGCTVSMDAEEDWPQDDYSLSEDELTSKCDDPELLEVNYVGPNQGTTYFPGDMLVIQAEVKTCRKLKGIRAEIVREDDPKQTVHKYGLTRVERGSDMRQKAMKVPKKKDGRYTLSVVVEWTTPKAQPDGRMRSVTQSVTTEPVTFVVETPGSGSNGTDSGVPTGECVDGQTRACGTDVGECLAGVRTCAGATWGACVGGVAAVAETCNGKDDDCNGVIDNGCPVPTPTQTTCGGRGLDGALSVTDVAITASLPYKGAIAIKVRLHQRLLLLVMYSWLGLEGLLRRTCSESNLRARLRARAKPFARRRSKHSIRFSAIRMVMSVGLRVTTTGTRISCKSYAFRCVNKASASHNVTQTSPLCLRV